MKTKFNKFIIRWWPFHPHIISVIDMATGVSDDGGVSIPVTAFKFRCRLCGCIFTDVCVSGVRLLQTGMDYDDVFQWLDEKEK